TIDISHDFFIVLLRPQTSATLFPYTTLFRSHGDDADFTVGEERSLWSDYFAREKDRLLLHCDEAKVDNRVFGNEVLEFHYNRVRDLKSTRLNSSHGSISYAIFYLNK